MMWSAPGAIPTNLTIPGKEKSFHNVDGGKILLLDSYGSDQLVWVICSLEKQSLYLEGNGAYWCSLYYMSISQPGGRVKSITTTQTEGEGRVVTQRNIRALFPGKWAKDCWASKTNSCPQQEVRAKLFWVLDNGLSSHTSQVTDFEEHR